MIFIHRGPKRGASNVEAGGFFSGTLFCEVSSYSASSYCAGSHTFSRLPTDLATVELVICRTVCFSYPLLIPGQSDSLALVDNPDHLLVAAPRIQPFNRDCETIAAATPASVCSPSLPPVPILPVSSQRSASSERSAHVSRMKGLRAICDASHARAEFGAVSAGCQKFVYLRGIFRVRCLSSGFRNQLWK